mgnify:CR=1 FL=1
MNRDLFLMLKVMELNKNEIDKMPSWARAEHLYNCSVPSKSKNTKSHRRVFVK